MDTTICEIFRKVYNTYILDILDIKTRDLFISICRQANPKNRLTKMILDHYESKISPPVARYISGPSYLTVLYSQEYLKFVYIFGDKHTQNDEKIKQCIGSIPIYDYIQQLIKKNDVFLDIFLEIPLYHTEQFTTKNANKLENSYMGKTFTMLKKSELANIRFHQVDARYKDIMNYNELTWFVNKRDISITDDRVIKIFENLQENYEKYIISQLFTPIIQKEIDRSEKGKTISKYIIKESKRRWDFYKMPIYNLISSLYRKYNKESVNKLKIYFTYITFVMLDLYLLSRIFKKFDNVTDQPIEPSNIIIYTGSKHAEIQTAFFKYMGFDVIEEAKSIESDKRCLDMRTVKQPFFSY